MYLSSGCVEVGWILQYTCNTGLKFPDFYVFTDMYMHYIGYLLELSPGPRSQFFLLKAHVQENHNILQRSTGIYIVIVHVYMLKGS